MDIDVYPNPANDVLNIEVKGVIKDAGLTATIMNTEGKTMSTENIHKDYTIMNISTLPSGIYTIKVVNQNQVIFVRKFIKIQ